MKLRIFISKPIDLEVTSNPKLLYNAHPNIKDLTVHGLKIGDNSLLIPQDNVLTTTFEKAPQGAIGFLYKNNRTYYKKDDVYIEYELTDRIKSVLKFGGVLHRKTGAKYVVRDNSIIGIGIHNELVKPYKKIIRKEVEKKFGKADKIIEIHEEIDGSLFYTEFIYTERQMNILFDEWDKTIYLINLGDFYLDN